MSKGIRFSFKSVFVCAGITLAAIAAAMLVDFSPATRRENVPATKQAHSGLSGSVNRPVTVAGTPANRLMPNYGKLPLSFEANQGQTDGQVKFLSRGRGYALFLTSDEAVLSLRKARAGVAPTFRSAVVGASSASPRPNAVRPYNSAALPRPLLLPSLGMKDEWGQELERPRDRRAGPALPSSFGLADSGESSAVLRMRLVGANAKAAVTGAEELPGKSNYFIGNDPKKWRTNVPNYAKVKYAGVYPGVDLVYYGNQGGQLEYDFVVAPGADPSAIVLDVGAVREPPTVAAVSDRRSAVGTPPLQIAADGDLVVKTDSGEVRFHKPVVYQPATNGGQRTTDYGQRTPVDGHYILEADNRVQFQVAPYDHSKALFIDPVLSYSTYLGGGGIDEGYGIAVDSSGNAYVTGFTWSTDFPTVNPVQATCVINCFYNQSPDAFVTKFNAAGSALVYSTYLGGSTEDWGYGIAVDSSGNAYVTGTTTSTDFPTVNPFQATKPGDENAFVAKLNAAGSALVYSTYLGGSSSDGGQGIAVDSSGNAYVTGSTWSSNFPITPGAFQTTAGSAFVTKFNAAGSLLVYSARLGVGNDVGNGIAVDSSGNAYVTGQTDGATAFVAKLNAAGSALLYSMNLSTSYSGYSDGDSGQGIAVDSSGNAYVTGRTASTNFPTVNPFQANKREPDGYATAFVAKLNSRGSALVYSTYLGGSGSFGFGDYGFGIAVDSSGDAYVTGTTNSSDFPTAYPIQMSFAGGFVPLGSWGWAGDAFVTEFNAAGSALVYSTYLGGSGGDRGNSIAVDSSGNAYVTGLTASTDFPTVNPLQASNDPPFDEDAFVAKISPAGTGPSVSLSPTNLMFTPQGIGTTSASQTLTLTSNGIGALSVLSIVASGDFAESNNCGSSVAGLASCTITVTFAPTAILTRAGALTITDNAWNSPQTVALSGIGELPVMFLPTSLNFGSQAENAPSAPQAVILNNTQSTALAMSVSTSSDFAQTNTCGSSVPARSKCTISVTFTPSIVGVETGTLTVTDGASSSPQTVILSGRGILQAQLSTPSVVFAAQTVGNTSPPWNVLFGNNLTTALPISITFAGANPGDFAETDNCGGSLAAKSHCTISLTFTPTATGTRTATLTVTDSANNSPQTMALSGTGE